MTPHITMFMEQYTKIDLRHHSAEATGCDDDEVNTLVKKLALTAKGKEWALQVAIGIISKLGGRSEGTGAALRPHRIDHMVERVVQRIQRSDHVSLLRG
jgi:hypothetical protein